MHAYTHTRTYTHTPIHPYTYTPIHPHQQTSTRTLFGTRHMLQQLRPAFLTKHLPTTIQSDKRLIYYTPFCCKVSGKRVTLSLTLTLTLKQCQFLPTGYTHHQKYADIAFQRSKIPQPKLSQPPHTHTPTHTHTHRQTHRQYT